LLEQGDTAAVERYLKEAQSFRRALDR
jgi:hypothetical protein